MDFCGGKFFKSQNSVRAKRQFKINFNFGAHNAVFMSQLHSQMNTRDFIVLLMLQQLKN
jgi:hypothetical protein